MFQPILLISAVNELCHLLLRHGKERVLLDPFTSLIAFHVSCSRSNHTERTEDERSGSTNTPTVGRNQNTIELLNHVLTKTISFEGHRVEGGHLGLGPQHLRHLRDAQLVQLIRGDIQFPQLGVLLLLDQVQQEHEPLRLDAVVYSSLHLPSRTPNPQDLQHVYARLYPSPPPPVLTLLLLLASLPAVERVQSRIALRQRLEQRGAPAQRNGVVYR